MNPFDPWYIDGPAGRVEYGPDVSEEEAMAAYEQFLGEQRQQELGITYADLGIDPNENLKETIKEAFPKAVKGLIEGFVPPFSNIASYEGFKENLQNEDYAKGVWGAFETVANALGILDTGPFAPGKAIKGAGTIASNIVGDAKYKTFDEVTDPNLKKLYMEDWDLKMRAADAEYQQFDSWVKANKPTYKSIENQIRKSIADGRLNQSHLDAYLNNAGHKEYSLKVKTDLFNTTRRAKLNEIWQKTGFYRSPEGRMMWELPTNKESLPFEPKYSNRLNEYATNQFINKRPGDVKLKNILGDRGIEYLSTMISPNFIKGINIKHTHDPNVTWQATFDSYTTKPGGALTLNFAYIKDANGKINFDKLRSSIVHEIQHAVQKEQGLPYGSDSSVSSALSLHSTLKYDLDTLKDELHEVIKNGSSDYQSTKKYKELQKLVDEKQKHMDALKDLTPTEIYQKYYGEIEARLTEIRSSMKNEDLNKINPMVTEEVDPYVKGFRPDKDLKIMSHSTDIKVSNE